jgi:hypothetical protein
VGGWGGESAGRRETESDSKRSAAGVVAFAWAEKNKCPHLFVLVLLVPGVRLGAALGVFIAPVLTSTTCVSVEGNRGKDGSWVSVGFKHHLGSIARRLYRLAIRLPPTHLAAFCFPLPPVDRVRSKPTLRYVAPHTRRVLSTGSAPVASGRVRLLSVARAVWRRPRWRKMGTITWVDFRAFFLSLARPRFFCELNQSARKVSARPTNARRAGRDSNWWSIHALSSSFLIETVWQGGSRAHRGNRKHSTLLSTRGQQTPTVNLD